MVTQTGHRRMDRLPGALPKPIPPDAMRMKCVGVQDGDHWVINGTKTGSHTAFLPTRPWCSYVRAICSTATASPRLWLNAVHPGFKAGKKENKLGMRCSETVSELVFEDCRVHKDNMLGSLGEGFGQAMKVSTAASIPLPPLSLGIARGVFGFIKYARGAPTVRQTHFRVSAIAFKLADMATEIEASELADAPSGRPQNPRQKMTTAIGHGEVLCL